MATYGLPISSFPDFFKAKFPSRHNRHNTNTAFQRAQETEPEYNFIASNKENLSGFQWHSKAHLCVLKELLNEEVCFLKGKENLFTKSSRFH